MKMTVFSAFLDVILSTLRVSTPLIFAALGGMMSERSGVINIALEGFMLVGAFFGASTALSSHSPWVGSLAALAAGGFFALFYGLLVIRLRANQIVAGTAVNMLAMGLIPFLSKVFYGSTTAIPSLPIESRFHSAPMIVAWGFVLVSWYWIHYMPSGLWVRFAGEHPHALEAAGVRVNRVRWFSVLASGCLAGLGGATLSLCLASTYSRNMTSGRGFMALAALIFGRWMPVPAALACVLFGFVDAIQIRLQGVILWGNDPVPVQFIQILPYLMTIAVLAAFGTNRSGAPKALGTPFVSK